MREEFVPKNFSDEHMAIIVHADAYIDDMAAQGYRVTLRQIFYMFVAEGEEAAWFANTPQNYKRLGTILGHARLAGLIDWDSMEDRGRSVDTVPSWENPQAIMEAVVDQYQEDLWAGQSRRVHFRIEKDALSGVILPICKRWRVPHIACRGNTSHSEAYEAGKLLRRQLDEGLWPLVIYMGDHDPTGLDMTRDTESRLSLFAREKIEVRRIALNYDQIEELRLPHNPLKLKDDGSLSDSRGKGYRAIYGNESWELDALKPRYIDDLISAEISKEIDFDIWNRNKAAEEHNQRILASVLNRWEDVEELFGGDE